MNTYSLQMIINITVHIFQQQNPTPQSNLLMTFKELIYRQLKDYIYHYVCANDDITTPTWTFAFLRVYKPSWTACA